MENKVLLLAEDDEMFASLLHYRLEKGGYDVVLHKDGREVKNYLNHSLPDVIVSDIMMPFFSGLELVDHVRNELNSEIPIILISAAGNETNVLNAFELGANDFLPKPVSPSELMARLAKELNKI